MSDIYFEWPLKWRFNICNEIRDAIFSHEMFNAHSRNVRYPIRSIRMHEPTWDFSHDEIEIELKQMEQEGLIECFDENWEPTYAGLQSREQRWQELSLRHPALISQQAALEELVLALVASYHRGSENERDEQISFLEDTLHIFLWKIPEDDILNAVANLIESDHLNRSEIGSFLDKPQLYLTANGRIRYARRIIAELGLVPPATILAEVKEPPPIFLELELPPSFADNLTYRWEEARRCQEARAWLAATILYGSILESILHAALEHDSTLAMQSALAPKKEGRVIPIDRWSLQKMLEIAADLEWINPTLQSHGHILRNSRNLVHPAKQIRERLIPTEETVSISRVVVKAVTNSFVARMRSMD